MHSSNKIIFLAELIGTFGLVVTATGSMVYDVSLGGIYGHHFIVAMHFIGLSIVVYAFGKYSMAHFNPAVTVGFFITKHVKGRQLPYYFQDLHSHQLQAVQKYYPKMHQLPAPQSNTEVVFPSHAL